MKMNQKKKICSGCNTAQYLFSHGLCRRCYNIPEKRSKVGLKALKRLSPRRKTNTLPEGQHSLKPPYFGFKSELELMFYLWRNYPRDKEGRMFCEFTGMRIDMFENSNRFINCFSHILPKGLYPMYKLNPNNIRIVHPDFHYATEFFTEDERRRHPDWDFDKWWSLVSEMKELYKQINI